MLTVDGDIHLEGRPVADLGELIRRMEELIKRGPVVVTLHADARVAYSRVVEVVDHIKQLGIAKVSFSVVPHTEEPKTPDEDAPPASQVPNMPWMPPKPQAPRKPPKPRQTPVDEPAGF